MVKIKNCKIAVITLDLEYDHASLVSRKEYRLWNIDKTRKLINLLKKHNIPLSVFVVGNSLKKNKKTIHLFQKYDCDFYLHSYSHDINEPDSISEIKNGKKAFKDFFGQSPKGYRAPMGLITPEGIKRLERENFEFDASIIPSFWPHPKYFKYPNQPFFSNKLLEIPFSTISPLRFVVALSWIKLFGSKFYKILFNKFSHPKHLLFAFHLHDLWTSPLYDKLPLNWKLVYSRNKDNGFLLLDDFLYFLKSQGYTFSSLKKLAKNYS